MEKKVSNLIVQHGSSLVKVTKDSNYKNHVRFWVFFHFAYIAITLLMCPYLNGMLYDLLYYNSYGFYVIMIYSILFHSWVNRFFLKKDYAHSPLDLTKKFFLLKIKKLTNFINLVVNKIKKLFNFLWFLLYRLFFIITTCVRKITTWILWRPLFKRWSYYGNYKNSKSKLNNLN